MNETSTRAAAAAADARALSGVRILDLGQHEAGSACTQLLGWMGADVIKVETPKTGDPGRRIGSPLQTAAPDPKGFDAWYFLMFNANKRSITLNLKNPEGLATFKQLVAHADVVVENFAPGTLERMGLGYDVLSAINPRIIVGRIKGFGLSGPYSEFRSFDTIGQAVGGMFALTGPVGGEPLRAGPSIADSGSGLACAFGIASALVQRARTGKGQVVEVSMQEAIMNLTRGRFSDYYKSEPHKAPNRLGNFLVRGVPAGLFPCKGGGPNDYIYIISNAALQPNSNVWDTLATTIGRLDLVGDERYTTDKGRQDHKDEINGIFREWTMAHTKYEVMETLGAAGILCGAVLDMSDQMQDRHLLERGAMADFDHPTRGHVRMPGSPVRLSDSPLQTRSPPLLGEHTAEVMAELLGCDADHVANMRKAGIV